MKKPLFLLFFLFFTMWAGSHPASGCGKDPAAGEARKIVHRFFTMVHRRDYRGAYNQFSRSVQKQVSPARFREGARDVRYLKITKIKVVDREENLIKMQISSLIHLQYKGNLYEAVYQGKVDVYREKGNWKVMTVELKATSSKPLNKKAPPGELQKLDFGT